MMKTGLVVLWLSALVPCSAVSSVASRPTISVDVDARDAGRRILCSEISLPVNPGRLTLVYPRWAIPSYEAPAAILDNIVRLRMSANGQPLEWKRDLVDLFAFHVVIPKGVRTLKIAMDVVAPTQRSDLNAATGQLLILDWQTIVLYPRATAVDDLLVNARLRLPHGWKHASALASVAAADDMIEFAPTSLAALVDSPVLASKFLRSFEIQSELPQTVFVDVAADKAEAPDLPTLWSDRFRRVLAEADVLFGGRPYRAYHFLVALSDEVGNDGLEHRESSDIRLSSRAFLDETNRLAYGYLIPHEYVHAWNGKFAIPAGLVRRDFQEPQTTELLWVYEGLTRYLNWVLVARAGILTPQEAHDYAALLAAKVTHRSGREWRSLQDTAVSAGILNDAPDQWESLRRGTDYYDEGLFIWLEVDATIRRMTGGRRSLDDFCRTFFGPRGTQANIRSYTFDDVVAALNGIAAYDWKALLQARLNSTGSERGPLDGLTLSGWNLAYGNVTGSVQAARDSANRTVEERFSVGLLLQQDGTIIDVVRDAPAWNSGLGPGMKVLSINGLPWSEEALRTAIAADVNDARMLNLTVQNGFETVDMHVEHHRGARYPRLERVGGEDLMGDILKSRVTVSQK